MPVKIGNKVRVDYEGSFEDGRVFDSTYERKKPFEFEVGTKTVIKGFEKAIIDMKDGDEKELTIKPEDAYGLPDPKMIRLVPKSNLPKEALKVNTIIAVELPEGAKVGARVVKLTEEGAIIDINHPLAGKTLKFKLKLLKIL